MTLAGFRSPTSAITSEQAQAAGQEGIARTLNAWLDLFRRSGHDFKDMRCRGG